jgi:hypothetical protein
MTNPPVVPTTPPYPPVVLEGELWAGAGWICDARAARTVTTRKDRVKYVFINWFRAGLCLTQLFPEAEEKISGTPGLFNLMTTSVRN